MAIITPSDYQNVAIAASAYFEELIRQPLSYMDTDIVTKEPGAIDVTGDSFIGQLRFYRDDEGIVNVPSFTDPTAGTTSSMSTGLLTYIKTARSWGYETHKLNQIITQEGGLKKAAIKIAEKMKRDMRKALDADLFNILKGYADALVQGPGITDFGQYDDPSVNFYIDVNADGHFGAAPTSAATARTLVDVTGNAGDGIQRLVDAIGMAWGEKEADYYYLVVDTRTLSAIRNLNITDQTTVVDGNIEFETISRGKFRLIVRNTTPTVAPGAHLVPPTNNVTEYSTRASYVIEPGALAFKRIPIEVPFEYRSDPAAYQGGGKREIWGRVAYVMHPYGVSWTGPTTAFPTGTDLSNGSNWTVEYKNTNLAILPIFHA